MWTFNVTFVCLNSQLSKLWFIGVLCSLGLNNTPMNHSFENGEFNL